MGAPLLLTLSRDAPLLPRPAEDRGLLDPGFRTTAGLWWPPRKCGVSQSFRSWKAHTPGERGPEFCTQELLLFTLPRLHN